MKTLVQAYASQARMCRLLARKHPLNAKAFRDEVHRLIAEGKRYRSIKRQADMWGQMFDSFAGGRR